LLDVQKTSAEHLQTSCTAQAQGSQCIWGVAELLDAVGLAATGHSAAPGASGHCAGVCQLYGVCVGVLMLSGSSVCRSWS